MLQSAEGGSQDLGTSPKPKEGIEKIDLPPRFEYETGPDGKVIEKVIPQWEIRATGKKYVQELRGIFKGSGEQMLHESLMENKAIGLEKITRPDGSTDEVRADKVEMYRRQPGFCVHATRPTFVLNVPWEGAMKRLGIRRQRITKDYTETWYHDGRHVLEERHVG
jgi:hypothetical protein